jgi:hypothetical protein
LVDPNLDPKPLAKFLLDSHLCRLRLHIEIRADESDDHDHQHEPRQHSQYSAEFLHRLILRSRYRKESIAQSRERHRCHTQSGRE